MSMDDKRAPSASPEAVRDLKQDDIVVDSKNSISSVQWKQPHFSVFQEKCGFMINDSNTV